MKHLVIFVLALVLVMLGGCIEGDEEVFISADGSARVKAVYKVPGVLFSAEDAEELRVNIREKVGMEKNLRLLVNRVDKVNGNRVVTIEIETDDVLALEGALEGRRSGVTSSKSGKILQAILGRVSVRQEGLVAEVNREVDLKPLLDEYVGKNGNAVLGDSEFRYTVHFPDPVDESNAHTVENGGRTLKWAYKLSESGKKPMVLRVVASVSVPYWVYGVGAVVLVMGIWAVYTLASKLRRRGRVGRSRGVTT